MREEKSSQFTCKSNAICVNSIAFPAKLIRPIHLEICTEPMPHAKQIQRANQFRRSNVNYKYACNLNFREASIWKLSSYFDDFDFFFWLNEVAGKWLNQNEAIASNGRRWVFTQFQKTIWMQDSWKIGFFLWKMVKKFHKISSPCLSSMNVMFVHVVLQRKCH